MANLFKRLFGKNDSPPALTTSQLQALATSLGLEFRPMTAGGRDELAWEITGKVGGRSVKLERVRRGSLNIQDSVFLFTVATRNKSGVVGELGAENFLTQDHTHTLESIARPATTPDADNKVYGYILGRFNPETLGPLKIGGLFRSDAIGFIGVLFETDTVSVFFDYAAPDQRTSPEAIHAVMDAAVELAIHLES